MVGLTNKPIRASFRTLRKICSKGFTVNNIFLSFFHKYTWPRCLYDASAQIPYSPIITLALELQLFRLLRHIGARLLCDESSIDLKFLIKAVANGPFGIYIILCSHIYMTACTVTHARISARLVEETPEYDRQLFFYLEFANRVNNNILCIK